MSRAAEAWVTPPRLRAGDSVSGEVYRDPAIFAAERKAVFERGWHLAAHESELPEVHDYRTFEYLGQPWFLIRGPDGAIRAFVNACAHRGARLLAEPAGNARRITCFYHLWTYDADGRCIGIPRPEGYAASGLDRSMVGLRRLRTETRLGLVFVSSDDGAPPLDQALGGALDPFEAILGDLPLEVIHYSRSTLACNWKAWAETNLDLYHEYMHVVLRKTQVDAMPMAERRLRLYPGGHAGSDGLKAAYEGYAGFTGRGGEVEPLPGTGPADFRYSVLFPASAVLSRGTVVRIDTATPLSSGETMLEMRGLGVRGESEAERRVRIRHFNQYWGPFGRNVPEDMLAAEACDATFRPGAARWQIIARDEGLTGQDDAALRHFYAEWSRRLGRSPAAPCDD